MCHVVLVFYNKFQWNIFVCGCIWKNILDVRAQLDLKASKSWWEGPSRRWPTAPSVCQKTSLQEDWSQSPTSTTETMASDCGTSFTGLHSNSSSHFQISAQISAVVLKTITNVKLFCFCSFRFVKGMVRYYYPTDSDVQKDSELQEWISEIFTHGFLGNKDSGRD